METTLLVDVVLISILLENEFWSEKINLIYYPGFGGKVVELFVFLHNDNSVWLLSE